DMKEDKCKFQFIGDLSLLPEQTRIGLEKLVDETKDFDEIIFTLAVAYGGRDEIIRGIKKFVKSGENIENLTEENFREFLDVSILPNTDVIVRTGGDYRTSGYMLYDSPYAELYFTDRKWPEFDETDLQKVIDFFENSKRNFGK
ncbi:MAG: undecaprenyl diphosphate synthase family protein, partial [Candidatus Gracilibacteria bacterium]|nr:undecaprenyl diphosphate synthase family protein [Candidatus Gracilibacteria bacterium]